MVLTTPELTPRDRYVLLPLPERHAVCDAVRSMQLDTLPENLRAVAQAMIDAYGICNAKYCAALWRNW